MRKIFLIFFVTAAGLLAACQTKPVSPTRPPTPVATAAAAVNLAVRVQIPQEGAYEISADDLRAAGYPLDQVAPENFRLFWRGQPQPLSVDHIDGAYRLRFYGRSPDSAYSPESIYILRYDSASPAVPFRQQDLPAPGTPADVYTATVHVEQNLQYAPQPSGGDHWFWQAIPSKQTKTFEIDLPQAVTGSVRLRLAVWSGTEASADPDHHLMASIGATQVLDSAWDGTGYQVIEGIVPAGVLVDGKNQVDVSLPGDIDVVVEKTFVNWLEVEYPRRTLAQEDMLTLEMAGAPIKPEGFSGPLTIWDVTVPTDTLQITASSDGFQGEAGRRYLLIGPQGFRKPARIEPLMALPDLAGEMYLAIGPDDLLQPLQPLLDWRSAHGLKAAAAPLQAIYDQFGDGYPEPQAIQRFLKQAAPQYVLLVGDYTYDPLGYTVPPEANRLPSFFVQTVHGGQTVSDVPFAQINDDPWPDLALGRLPARTSGEVGVAVAKTLAFEQQTDVAWRSRLLAIADGQDASFKGDAEKFISLFPSDFTKELYTPPSGAADANLQVLKYLADGYGLVAYFGHGSINMWGKDRIFHTDDIASLSNTERLPVVINMNCLTGLYTHPKVSSLAEMLLWKENGGAVLVMAPTSLTLPADQALLSQAFVKAFTADPKQPLGKAFLAAQRQMPTDMAGANEVLLTFLLYGDPALAIGK